MFEKLKQLFYTENIRSFALLFSTYWLIGFLVYFKASNSLLTDDGIAGLVKFETMGWTGFKNSFGFTSLYYFHDLFNLLVYLLVGKSSFGWFMVMITLPSINATLSFAVFKKFYSILRIKHALTIAILGSLLFLLSPYQTENIVWAATLHYSLALLIFLISSLLMMNNLEAGAIKNKTVLVITGLFIVSLLTLEISLIFPFAYFCLAIPIIWNKKTAVKFSELTIRFLLPLLATICAYFIATRLIKGHWIPHYGATHLQNNTLQVYSTAVARYVVKLASYIHFANYSLRESVYVFCERWKVMLCIELISVAAMFLIFYALKKKEDARTFLCIVILSLILLLPSLHMYFMYLFNTENDRLSYFFSVAFYQLIPFVLLNISFYAGLLITITYSLFGLHFLQKQVTKWHEAGVVHNNCINSFTWTASPKLYVLNAPTNYNGVYEFRNNDRLPYALSFLKNYKKTENIVQVLSSNYTSLNDSTIVTIENDSTLHVALVNSGGWLMNEFIGASSYESENYKVDVETGTSYRLIFHRKDSNAVYIYSSGSGFYKVKGF